MKEKKLNLTDKEKTIVQNIDEILQHMNRHLDILEKYIDMADRRYAYLAIEALEHRRDVLLGKKKELGVYDD